MSLTVSIGTMWQNHYRLNPGFRSKLSRITSVSLKIPFIAGSTIEACPLIVLDAYGSSSSPKSTLGCGRQPRQ